MNIDSNRSKSDNNINDISPAKKFSLNNFYFDNNLELDSKVFKLVKNNQSGG